MRNLEKCKRPLAIYAHLDDEIIGCSNAIHLLRKRIHVAYATDGMPSPIEDPSYFHPHTNYKYGDDYKSMRQQEAVQALSILGVTNSSRLHFLDLPDSTLLKNIGLLKERILELLKFIKPDLIITASYEGGHIDHDVLTAVIWHCTEGTNINICETPLYSLGESGFINHNFPTDRHRIWNNCVASSLRVMLAKRLAFQAYVSQEQDIRHFSPLATESYFITNRGNSPGLEAFRTAPNGSRILYEKGGNKFSDFISAVSSLSPLE